MDSFHILYFQYITTGSFPVSTVPVPTKILKKSIFFSFILGPEKGVFHKF